MSTTSPLSGTPHYSPVAKILHWLVAGMIVVQFVLATLAERAEESGLALRQLALLANHKSVGITILALAVLRLVWRFRHVPPALPATMPRWQLRASQFSHWSLYGLIFVLPITGWLMSSASAYSVSWFNVLQLPDFVAPDPDLKKTLQTIHGLLAKLLFAVAALHIGAALKHALLDKDDVLQRMLSTVALLLFIAVIALGVTMLGNVSSRPATVSTENIAEVVVAAPIEIVTEPAIAEAPISAPVEVVAPAAVLAAWKIDHAASFIRFTASQAGADFDGVWQRWSAELRFAGDDLAGSMFDVTVQTADVETGDDDRDQTLADPEWFDSKEFPEAYYLADTFLEKADGSYVAQGTLKIKGVSAPVDLMFTVTENGAGRTLVGKAKLKRLVLGVGSGEWEDTEWIGDDVVVNVRVVATVE